MTLNYWDFLDPSQANPRSKALKENIANFEAANPDIKINLSVVSLGDMLNRLPQSAAAGQTPDVFKMFTPIVPQMASAGVYSPLPDAASKVSDWLRPTDTFAGPDGKQVAVPYEYRTCALYYNQKSFLRSVRSLQPPTRKSSTSHRKLPQLDSPGSEPGSRTLTIQPSSALSSTAS